MRYGKAICVDFTALAGEALLDELEKEFQYQMDLSDGCYVFWNDEAFQGWRLSPATTSESQAILQFFADCACPISLHRLGCSLSPRNAEHGPITSNELAIRCLLQGFETIANWKYDPKIKSVLNVYRATNDYLLACDILATYWEDIQTNHLCPEVFDTVIDLKTLGGKH
ncbi:MAG: hypothetical protein AAF431_14390 [Pseudomonadota bacterium]